MKNGAIVDESQVPDTPTPAPKTCAQAKRLILAATSMSSGDSIQNQQQEDGHQLQPPSVPAVRTRSKTIASGVPLPVVEKWGPPLRRKRSKKPVPDLNAESIADLQKESVSQRNIQNTDRYSNLSFL